MQAYLLPETIMSIKDKDTESSILRKDEHTDLDSINRFIDDILISLV